jgi:hypothetical protein
MLVPMRSWVVLLEQARQILTGEQEALQIEVPARPERIEDVRDRRTSTLIPAPAGAQGFPAGARTHWGDQLSVALRRARWGP